jgi:DNA-binding protein H-NS
VDLLANFASMSVDELWEIHEDISKALEATILAEKKKLERRLNSLQPAKTDLKARRPYPPVFPKFANPDDPSQVWSGRGKRPQWVTEKLASGLTLEDLSIGHGPSVAAMPEEDVAEDSRVNGVAPGR